MNLKDKTKRDERINAPLISWKAYLVIVAIVYLLLVTQAIIIYSWMGEMLTFVMVMIYYLALTCLLLAVIYSLVNRFLVGNPVQRIAAAARKITLGDYSVRVEHIRKDGKRDEIEVLIEDLIFEEFVRPNYKEPINEEELNDLFDYGVIGNGTNKKLFPFLINLYGWIDKRRL